MGSRVKVTKVLRSIWVLTGALFLVLLAVWGPDALLPIIGLMVMSFPAGLLASPITAFIFDFPVRFDGLPFPSAWWIYAVLTLMLGYLQWFLMLPRLFATVIEWHRRTRL